MLATANGIPFKSTDANDLGMFDATCASRDELIDTAKTWFSAQDKPNRIGTPSRCIQTTNTDTIADAMGDVSDDLHGSLHADAVLDAIKVGINSGWNAALQAERDHLVKLRNTTPAQEAIEAFFSKSSKKPVKK